MITQKAKLDYALEELFKAKIAFKKGNIADVDYFHVRCKETEFNFKQY